LLASLHLDRKEEVARWIFALPEPTPAQRTWAAAQIGSAIPVEETPSFALAWKTPTKIEPMICPFVVRAASLTTERAAELVSDPSLETSWHVLDEAARIAKVPLWKLAPDAWQPAKVEAESVAPLTLVQ